MQLKREIKQREDLLQKVDGEIHRVSAQTQRIQTLNSGLHREVCCGGGGWEEASTVDSHASGLVRS